MADFTSILKALEDGQHHSVDELVARLDKGTIQPALDRFREDGLRIESTADRAIWLDATPVLCPTLIHGALDGRARQAVMSPEVFYSLDSTSSHLARQPPRDGMSVCLAEMQTAGRGRRGNHWISPPCRNIYLSLRRRFDCEPARLAGLSLAVGIVAARQLAPLSRTDVGLKWPNDLYIEGRKLGGILVELLSTSAGHADVVIGIGLNIGMQDEGQSIDHPWTSLHQHLESAGPIDRNQLVADLLNKLTAMLDDFPSHGEAFILSQWSDLDVAFGRQVTIQSGTEAVRGIGAGIDETYRFLLRNGDNTRSFHSGEVSLRIK